MEGRWGLSWMMGLVVLSLPQAMGSAAVPPASELGRMDPGAPWARLSTVPVAARKAGIGRLECVAAADVDGDGSKDLVVGWSEGGRGVVAWFRAPGPEELGPEPPSLGAPRVLAELPFGPDLMAVRTDAIHRPCQVWAGRRGRSGVAVVDPAPGEGWKVRLLEAPGPVTALAAGELGIPDGLWEVAVGVATPGGGAVQVVPGLSRRAPAARQESPAGTVLVPLEAPPEALVFGPVAGPGFHQLAVLAGGTISLLDPRRTGGEFDEAGLRTRIRVPTERPVEGLLPAPVFAAGARRLLAWDGEGCLLLRVGEDGAAQQVRLGAGDEGRPVALVHWRGDGGVAVVGTGGVRAYGVDRGAGTPAAWELGSFPALTGGTILAAVPVRLTEDAMEDLVGLVEDGSGRRNLVVVASTSRASFVVDSDADAPDASPGNGTCRTVFGDCTLRAAIQEANALPGPDTITFSSGFTIQPSSPLPPITEAVTITSSGSSARLDGTNLPAGSDGLVVQGGPSAIERLTIVNVPANGTDGGDGVVIDGADGNTLMLGSSQYNGGDGVELSNSSNNQITYFTAAWNGLDGFRQLGSSAGNTYSGCYAQSNGANGIEIFGTSDTTIGTCDGGDVMYLNLNGIVGARFVTSFAGTRMCGCLVGAVNAGGWQAQPNQVGVFQGARGGLSLTGNTISGNTTDGVWIHPGPGAERTVLQDNRIGTDDAGTQAVPNQGWGVSLGSADNVSIGSGNCISGNQSGGILLGASGTSPSDISITGNRIGVGENGALLPNQGPAIEIASDSSSVSVAVNDLSAAGTPAFLSGPSPVDRDVTVWQNSFYCTSNGDPSAMVDGSAGIDFGANWFNGNCVGVAVVNGGYARVSGGNRSFDCGLLVDLENDGPTPNDPGDGDAGSNDLLNYPQMGVVRACGGQTHVSMGWLDIPAGADDIVISLRSAASCCAGDHAPAAWLEGNVNPSSPGMWSADLDGELTGDFLIASTEIRRDPGLGFPVWMTSEPSECVEVLPTYGGDADDDCSWDARDVALVIANVAGEPLPAGGNADCDASGDVTSDDVSCTAREIFVPHMQ